MRVLVLGPVGLADEEGREVEVRGAQMRRLLAALAVHAPDPVSVDALIEVLWPDRVPSANALQALVSKLRKAAAPLTITMVGRGYSLDVDRGCLDVAEFERLVASGRDALADGDPERAAEHLAAALRRWRGRPFDDVADHALGQAASARLAALRSAAVAARLDAELALGHLDDAGADLDRLVVEEPLDERWWALLALLRYRQQRQGDALRALGEARRMLAEELGIEPGPELRELEARILAQDPSLLGDRARAPAAVTAVTRRNTLPSPVASFVGRKAELADLGEALEGSRLVTLLGPGGAGKSTTALELARHLVAGGGTSAQFVALAGIGAGGSVVEPVLTALGLLEAVDRSLASTGPPGLDRVVDLVGEQRLLLVLDNCEHVIDSAAEVSAELLAACPGLRILATSREPLGVAGERNWPLPPMDPDEAVALFAERAAAAGTGFVLDDASRPVVDQLVRRVDGLPLALELAAARLRSLGLADVLDRLDDRFELLSGGPRTAAPRQQTLRAVVNWSHDLLDDIERTIFRRMAAFAGGATLAQIEAVCADEAVPGRSVVEVVGRLVDKSLVVADHREHGTRYRMLQTLHDYAAEALTASGEAATVRLRHARHFADAVVPARHGLLGPDQTAWIHRLTEERENLAVALSHATAVEDAELALALTAPLGWYFFLVGDQTVGASWLEEALALGGPADRAHRSLALGSYAWLAASGPDITKARATADLAMNTLDTYDDPFVECFVASTCIMTYFFAGEVDLARQLYPRAAGAAERSGDRWCVGLATLIYAEIAHVMGDAAVAEREMTRSAEIFAALGDRFMWTICITESSEASEMRGDYDRAVRMLEEGLATVDQGGLSSYFLAARARLANLETLRGNLGLAAELHEAVLRNSDAQTSPWLQAMSFLGLAMIARRRHEPEQALELADRAWALPRSQAVPVMRIRCLVARGYALEQMERAAAALPLQTEALATARALGAVRVLAHAVEGLAGALAGGGDGAGAARLLGAADALRRRSGGSMPPAERFDVDRAETRARSLLGDAAFETRFAEGAAADPDTLFDEVSAAG